MSLGPNLGTLGALMEDALKSLIDAMGHGDRLTARPGRVLLDRPAGTEALEIAWSTEDHACALEAVETGSGVLDNGLAVSVVQGTLVVVRAADPNRRLSDWASDSALSAIAARTIEAALELGRNVLVAGGWPEASALMAAIVGGGRRPGAVVDPRAPTPASWVQLESPDEIAVLNADRVCLWRTPPEQVSRFALGGRALVAWVGASRLDRALMRYEVALESAEPRANTQMQLLAGLDLVVTVQRGPDGPRVREIAELVMMEDGYRPNLLFAPGAPPLQQTLVPMALPSFAAELRVAGYGALAEELEAAVGESAPRPAAPPASAPPTPAPVAAPPSGVAGRGPLGMTVFSRPTSTGELEELREAPPPGWELDQLGDEDLPPADYGEASADDAALAATYGLAPPPRPKGVSGESFDDILKKMRDGELQDPDE